MWRCLFKGLDWDSRLEARQLKMIQRTKRDIQLFRLWKRSPNIEVRIAAIYKLKNQKMLSHIAQAEQVDELAENTLIRKYGTPQIKRNGNKC